MPTTETTPHGEKSRLLWQSALAIALVGLAGATAAWPAWVLAAGLVPWTAGIDPSRRGRAALQALAAVLIGAGWGVMLDTPAAVWDRPLYAATVLLAGWAGARAARQQDALAQAGLSTAVLVPLTVMGWAGAQSDLSVAGYAGAAALSALLWAWAMAAFVVYARQERRIAAWGVSGLFFAATLSLAGLAWAASPAQRPHLATATADTMPTPRPALAATLTAVAQGAATPRISPSPGSTATATTQPSPTPTNTPTFEPTATPTPSPIPTFPPPPVYTGYGVVQVPPEWGQGAFVREAPRQEAPVVTVVVNGTLLKVLDYHTTGPQVWLKVRAPDATWEGWIISTALQAATPAP